MYRLIQTMKNSKKRIIMENIELAEALLIEAKADEVDMISRLENMETGEEVILTSMQKAEALMDLLIKFKEEHA